MRGISGLRPAGYAYAASGNRLLQAATGGVSRGFAYDATGNVTAYADATGLAHTLAYDPFGRLAGHTAQGLATTYTVNALDQRMGKRNASHQSRYVYAGFNQLLAEYTDGAWTSYVYRGGEPVALVRNDQLYFLHPDHLGRPQLATDAGQQVVWKAANRAFDRGVSLDTLGGLNLGFPGQYHDAESGLWHNGYREYDAGLGRYLQSDPIGLAGGVNTYAYVGGNPVTHIDPSGLLDPALELYAAGVTNQMPQRRGPDYLYVGFNIGAANFQFVLTRNGTLFQGIGGLNNRGNPAKFLASKPGISAGAGYMEGCPKSGSEVDGFVKGLTTSYGATSPYGIGMSRSTNSSGTAINLVIGTPGYSMDATYSEPIGSFGGW